jgi:hypothetical protein
MDYIKLRWHLFWARRSVKHADWCLRQVGQVLGPASVTVNGLLSDRLAAQQDVNRLTGQLKNRRRRRSPCG